MRSNLFEIQSSLLELILSEDFVVRDFLSFGLSKILKPNNFQLIHIPNSLYFS